MFAQQTSVVSEKFNYLIGSWKGEGSGKPGEGEGYFSFQFDLGNKILIRKNHTEFPASQNRPATIHDDLLIVYPSDREGNQKAIYFDNEGHVINYSISFSNENDIVFTSEKTPNMPVFRLTYSKLDSKSVNVIFEMSNDGVKFMKYVEGKSKKVE